MYIFTEYVIRNCSRVLIYQVVPPSETQPTSESDLSTVQRMFDDFMNDYFERNRSGNEMSAIRLIGTAASFFKNFSKVCTVLVFSSVNIILLKISKSIFIFFGIRFIDSSCQPKNSKCVIFEYSICCVKCSCGIWPIFNGYSVAVIHIRVMSCGRYPDLGKDSMTISLTSLHY